MCAMSVWVLYVTLMNFLTDADVFIKNCLQYKNELCNFKCHLGR